MTLKRYSTSILDEVRFLSLSLTKRNILENAISEAKWFPRDVDYEDVEIEFYSFLLHLGRYRTMNLISDVGGFVVDFKEFFQIFSGRHPLYGNEGTPADRSIRLFEEILSGTLPNQSQRKFLEDIESKFPKNLTELELLLEIVGCENRLKPNPRSYLEENFKEGKEERKREKEALRLFKKLRNKFERSRRKEQLRIERECYRTRRGGRSSAERRCPTQKLRSSR